MSTVPLESYPNLPPLFLDFARGKSRFYPDPPSIDAAAARGRELLSRSGPQRLTAEAFRFRGAAGRQAAEDFASGRAVAVLAGHQIGLLTGPLFTLGKAFDAITIARELSRRGVPAVPVFWALTDDHDLEEIARTAKPGRDGPQRLVLEGSDRSNRRPVGRLPIPAGISGILDAFRADVAGGPAAAFVDRIGERYAAGRTYGEAFVDALLDLTDGDPLLVLDPLGGEVAAVARDLFLAGAGRREALADALRERAAEIEREGRTPVVPFRPDVFPFFVIDDEIRRRVEPDRLVETAERVSRGELEVSADVLTRPVLKSLAIPAAASVLGPSEIAYHAQSLPLFGIFDAPVPVLLPRTLLVVRGPAERRVAEALGIAESELLRPDAGRREAPPVPQADAVEEIARRVEHELAALAPSIEEIDTTLGGSLETAKRKATYQLEQLAERMRKAVEKKDEVTRNRLRRLATMLLPGGEPAERVYPPLSFLIAWGESVVDAIRRAAGRATPGVALIDVDGAADVEARRSHAG